jgi:hypothetical protein
MDIDQLKREFAANPLAVIAVGSMAVTALAKIIDSASATQGRRAYAKQINHKVKNKKYHPTTRPLAVKARSFVFCSLSRPKQAASFLSLLSL